MDPVATTTYDWMHTLLQGGVFIVEVEAMLAEAAAFGVTRRAVQACLRDESWVFPSFTKTKSKQLHKVFDDKRQSVTDPGKVKCSCAEALGVYGLLRFFMESTVGKDARLHRQLASFRAVCTVLETNERFFHTSVHRGACRE